MASEKLKILIQEFAADGQISANEYALLQEKAKEEDISISVLDLLISNALEKVKHQEENNKSGFFVLNETPETELNIEKSGFYVLQENENQPQTTINVTDNNSQQSNIEKSLFSPSEAYFSNEQLLTNQGNMSEIYVGIRHIRKVIIKRLKPQDRKNELYINLLYKEFNNALALEHPNIVRVFDSGEDEKGPFYYMEYIDGRPLTTLIGKFGIQSHKLVQKLAFEILSALDYVHKKQVFHRDLKPDNILVTFKGDNVKILDFGLALTDDFIDNIHKVGTPKYAAPEQSNKDFPVDGRADLYAFGLILTEMITGNSKDAKKVGSFSKKMEQLIVRCTETLPVNRFLSAQEILTEFEKISIQNNRFADKAIEIEQKKPENKKQEFIVPKPEKANITEYKPKNENIDKKNSFTKNQNFNPRKEYSKAFLWIVFIILVIVGIYIFQNSKKGKTKTTDESELVQEPKIMYITAKKLRLRSSKEVNKKNVIGLYHRGTKVEIIEMDSQWAHVKILDKQGYMAFPEKFLSEEPVVE